MNFFADKRDEPAVIISLLLRSLRPRKSSPATPFSYLDAGAGGFGRNWIWTVIRWARSLDRRA